MKIKGYLLIDALILIIVVILITFMLSTVNQIDENFQIRRMKHFEFNAKINERYLDDFED